MVYRDVRKKWPAKKPGYSSTGPIMLPQKSHFTRVAPRLASGSVPMQLGQLLGNLSVGVAFARACRSAATSPDWARLIKLRQSEDSWPLI
jgi:hypothetical protein